jgi:hypothetical protein
MTQDRKLFDDVRIVGTDNGIQVHLDGHNRHVIYADTVNVLHLKAADTYDMSLRKEGTLVGSVRIDSTDIPLSELESFISQYAAFEVRQ